MEHVEEGIDKAFANFVEFLEGKGAIVELSVCDPVAEDFVDEVFNIGLGDLGQGATCGLDSIGEEDNSAFLEGGARAIVAVGALIDGGAVAFAFFFMGVVFEPFARLVVEVLDEAGAVVLFDDINDNARQFVFAGEFDAFLDVGLDNEGTHGRVLLVVGVEPTPLVFGKVFGFYEFADIVKEATDAAEEGAGTDRGGGVFGEVGNHEAVMVSAGCLDLHAAKEGVVEIGEFEQGDVGGDFKEVFKEG